MRSSLPDGYQLLLLSFLALPGGDNSIFNFLCQVFLRNLLKGRRVERLCFQQNLLLGIVSLIFCLVHPSKSYHLLKVNWNWLNWWWLWGHMLHHSHFIHDLPFLFSHCLANALLFKFWKNFLLGFWKSWKCAFLLTWAHFTVIFFLRDLTCSFVLRRIRIWLWTTLFL